MKEKILKIKHINFSMIGPGEWEDTEWNVFDDYTVRIEERFNNRDEIDIKEKTLTEEEYNRLMDLFTLAKTNTQVVEAYDGDAWEFAQFENNECIYHRTPNYTYGLTEFENLQNFLFTIYNK